MCSSTPASPHSSASSDAAAETAAGRRAEPVGPGQEPPPPGGFASVTQDHLQLPPATRVDGDAGLEAALVHRAQAGDTGAFDELVGIYGPRIYNVILRMVGNREDARDLTQITFLNVWRSIGRVDPQRRISCWIYQVALNQARNAIRDRKPRVALSERVADPGPSPEVSADRAEQGRILQEGLLVLGEADRDLLVLRYFGQLGLDEMSRVLEVPEKTIKSRLFSARRKLGRELMKRGLQGA